MKVPSCFLKSVALLAVSFFIACNGKKDFPVPSTVIDVPGPGSANVGKADFSSYVAIGNSLTAGFADGGLYRESQLNSYPAIIAQQMQKVGGGDFTQPLFGTAEANGSGYIRLAGFNADGTPSVANVTNTLGIRGTTTVAGRTIMLYNKYTGDNNNYGVPGIKLTDINDANYGNINGYFERLLPQNAPNNNSTYLDFVTRNNFTFFTNWLGNNDALSFATSGGVDALTDKGLFENTYTILLNRLTQNGAKGAVATIPDVTAIAYLHGITLSSILATAQKVNPAAKVYISARTSTGTYTTREARVTDLLILTFPLNTIGTGVQPYGLSPNAPIENKYVLDETEVALAQAYTGDYNAVIKKLAAQKGLALFDAYAFMNTLKSGITINGVNISSVYLTGGLFSLDGIHLTPRGYALVANQLIKAINNTYNTKLAEVDISIYRTLKQ